MSALKELHADGRPGARLDLGLGLAVDAQRDHRIGISYRLFSRVIVRARLDPRQREQLFRLERRLTQRALLYFNQLSS